MTRSPTARSSPSWGFSFTVAGMTRPDAVVCSASSVRTTTRSSSGLMETDTADLPFAVVGTDGVHCRRPGLPVVAGAGQPAERLAPLVKEYQEQSKPGLALGQHECQPPGCERLALD